MSTLRRRGLWVVPAEGCAMSNETVSAKRYTGPWVFVCAGCDLLAVSERSDKLCCDSTCRVRAMRNGSLDGLRAFARMYGLVDDHTGKPQVAGILQAAAIDRLRPGDLGKQIAGRKMTIAQAQPEMVREVMQRIGLVLERLHDHTH